MSLWLLPCTQSCYLHFIDLSLIKLFKFCGVGFVSHHDMNTFMRQSQECHAIHLRFGKDGHSERHTCFEGFKAIRSKTLSGTWTNLNSAQMHPTDFACNPRQQQPCLHGFLPAKDFMDMMNQHLSKSVSEDEMRLGHLLKSLPDLHFFTSLTQQAETQMVKSGCDWTNG